MLPGFFSKVGVGLRPSQIPWLVEPLGFLELWLVDGYVVSQILQTEHITDMLIIFGKESLHYHLWFAVPVFEDVSEFGPFRRLLFCLLLIHLKLAFGTV